MSKRFSILAAAVASLALGQAASASAITINFSTPSIDLTGGPVADTITISGLTAAGQAVTSYDLYVDYNPAQLSVTGESLGSLPGDTLYGNTGPGLGSATDSSSGVIELLDVSFSPDSAFSGQGDSYVIGTIDFAPLANLTGTSSPSFDFTLSQVTGLEAGACGGNAPPGSCPYPNLLTFQSSSVPEPSSFALFGLGLGAIGLGFAVSRRRRGAL